jgi:hypothetical protein
MRKFIFLLTIIISVSAFAEKLHTNGKNNLDKLVGNWGNYTYYIQNKGGKWYLGVSNWGDDTVDWILIRSYKNGIMVAPNVYERKGDRNFYFAYDTKYKIMVEVDTGLNIIQKIPKKFNTIGG